MLALLFLLAAATPLINAYMTVNISIICKFDSIHCESDGRAQKFCSLWTLALFRRRLARS